MVSILAKLISEAKYQSCPTSNAQSQFKENRWAWDFRQRQSFLGVDWLIGTYNEREKNMKLIERLKVFKVIINVNNIFTLNRFRLFSSYL